MNATRIPRLFRNAWFWIVGCLLLAAIGVVAVTAVVLPFRRIRQFQEAFALVGPGATVDEVIAVMGQPSQDIAGGMAAVAWWDDKPIEPALAGKTRRTLRYVVPTFFLPVSFDFSFDEEGRAIGKHRYD